MRKKLLLFLSSVLFMGSMSGCGINSENGLTNALREKRVETKAFKDLQEKDKVYALEKMLNEHDVDGIYELFSANIKGEIGEEYLREQVEGIFDYFGDSKFTLTFESETEGVENDYGVKDARVNSLYEIDVDGQKYSGEFNLITKSSESDDNIGLYNLQFATDEWIYQEENVFDHFTQPGVLIFY